LGVKADLLIVNAGQLVTCAGPGRRPKVGREMLDVGVIENGAVAVAGAEIVAVGKTGGLEKEIELTAGGRMIDAGGRLVMPGLVDPHTHLVFAGSREHELDLKLQGLSYLEILAQGGGILNTVAETRRASREDLVKAGMGYADEMLSQGTTTAEAKSGYGLTTDHEIKQLEAIREIDACHPIDLVPTFLGAHAVPREYTGRTDEYVALVVEEMLPAVKRHSLAEFCDVFCEEGVFGIPQSRRVLQRARELGFKLKIHADEIEPLGGAELAAELGAVSADHLLAVSEGGIAWMAQRGTIAVLLPGTSFNLRTGRYAPARKILDAGVPVALASDFNPGSCPTHSLELIMTLACLYLEMRPAEVVNAVTINAAHAIGRADRVGSIEPGKQADIVIFDVPNLAYLCYRFGTNLVWKVIKKGTVVIERGGEWPHGKDRPVRAKF